MASAYTPGQISEYLRSIDLTDTSPSVSLEFLTLLHKHQISSVAYENLSLHYSATKQITLEPQRLFAKLVHRRRGGYCLEAGVFYNHVLRALGFDVYTAGVRNRLRRDGVPHGPFVGWHHVVNVVTLPGGEVYMVDVCFGGDGPTRPLRMVSGVESSNLGRQSVRLVHGPLPDLVDASKRWWIYQYRNSEVAEWNSYYAFPEVEFSTFDFGVMNFWLVNHPDCFQRFMVLVVKFLREGAEITGKLMLVDDVVKRNLGGKTEVLQVMKTEEERREALKTWFGLEFTEDEFEGIRGHCTELPRST